MSAWLYLQGCTFWDADLLHERYEERPALLVHTEVCVQRMPPLVAASCDCSSLLAKAFWTPHGRQLSR